MSSPFALFRKYQRVAMVIITGMAMISFVALGMVNSPQEIPGPLMAVFLAMVVGCGMWVAGLNNEKSAEWGVMGAILGALLGLYFSMRMQTAPVAQLSKGGNISREQYDEMAMQRNTANQFMYDAMNRTEAGQFPGFSLLRDGDNRRDLIFCEILNREADRLKIAVPDKAVMAYLKEVTDKKLTYDVFEKIRQDMHSSDGLILDALRREIRAQQALRLLYPGQMLYGTSGSIISPEMRYEYFKKMNVRQSAELVALPVSEFEDGLPEPSDAELDELFQANRANFPNAEENGQPAEGRPGFRQPTRMRLAYVEASIPDFEGLVDEVTDEEIQQQYQENYKKPLPPSMQPGADGGPVLPPPPSSEPADGDSPPPPPKPESTAPATEGTTEGNAAEKTPAAETTPPTETPESETAKEESETPAKSTEEGEKTSSLPPRDVSLVAFFDDQPATEEKADAAPAAEEPAAKTEDAPEAKTDEAAKPEEKEGDAPTEPAKEEGTAEIAPPPTSAVRPLDDELKEEIRADIIRERAAAKSRETVQAARTHIEDLCRRHRVTDPDDEEHLTAEELSAAITKYADEHHLIYVETPFLSPQELISSEDYPVGMAFSMENQFQAVAQVIARSFPDELYRAFGAQDFRSGSEYIIWKLDHRESGIPESLDDDLVRDQVVKAWKRLQALPKAEARGEELAKKIEGLGEGVDLAMVFAEETVTGEKGALYLTVKETGSFSWLQRPQAPQLGMQQRQPVRPSTVNGAEDAGERFMEAVCNDMKVGDVRVVPNSDGTKLYVVRIISRVPEQNEDGESFLRKQFLATGNIPEYLQLGQADLVQLEDVPQQWVEEIWDRYDVLMAQPEAADAEETDDDTADAS
ncbi:MAG: hypothetical protein KDA69_02690 [Planctomycetaceae bacterium]|nr:hypothetical protein [Planctomycetaceae bacterium]